MDRGVSTGRVYSSSIKNTDDDKLKMILIKVDNDRWNSCYSMLWYTKLSNIVYLLLIILYYKIQSITVDCEP